MGMGSERGTKGGNIRGRSHRGNPNDLGSDPVGEVAYQLRGARCSDGIVDQNPRHGRSPNRRIGADLGEDAGAGIGICNHDNHTGLFREDGRNIVGEVAVSGTDGDVAHQFQTAQLESLCNRAGKCPAVDIVDVGHGHSWGSGQFGAFGDRHCLKRVTRDGAEKEAAIREIIKGDRSRSGRAHGNTCGNSGTSHCERIERGSRTNDCIDPLGYQGFESNSGARCSAPFVGFEKEDWLAEDPAHLIDGFHSGSNSRDQWATKLCATAGGRE